MKKLIGVTGAARAGKDTIAAYLVEKYNFDRYSFASPIKTACNFIFGWDSRHSDGSLKEIVDLVWGISPRFAYQTLGTQWGRDIIRDDIWIVAAKEFIKKTDRVVISDVRFDNEAEMILNSGGVLVSVIRNSDSMIELSSHRSESGLSLHLMENAYVINNTGSFVDLYKQLDMLMMVENA